MRRKHMTGEQAAAYDARRERVQQLCEQIRRMSEEARLALAQQIGQVLSTEQRVLSPANTCLLANQRPNCTIVGGFRQWQALGRQVRQGETALYIWVPRDRGRGEEPADPDTPPTQQSFLLRPVFDVSQTDLITTEAVA
jgi:N-terminal domain of anti-restriction factor ArdC